MSINKHRLVLMILVVSASACTPAHVQQSAWPTYDDYVATRSPGLVSPSTQREQQIIDRFNDRMAQNGATLASRLFFPGDPGLQRPFAQGARALAGHSSASNYYGSRGMLLGSVFQFSQIIGYRVGR